MREFNEAMEKRLWVIVEENPANCLTLEEKVALCPSCVWWWATADLHCGIPDRKQSCRTWRWAEVAQTIGNTIDQCIQKWSGQYDLQLQTNKRSIASIQTCLLFFWSSNPNVFSVVVLVMFHYWIHRFWRYLFVWGFFLCQDMCNHLWQESHVLNFIIWDIHLKIIP